MATTISKTVTFNTIATDAFASFRDDAVLQLYESRPLLNKLLKDGNIQENAGGGKEWIRNVRYGLSSQTRAWAGLDSIVGTRREYKVPTIWKPANIACPMVVADEDVVITSGSPLGFPVDLYKDEYTQALEDMNNYMAIRLTEDGTAEGGKTFTGLRGLVADNPTGTLAGIDQSTNTWWQNQSRDLGPWASYGWNGSTADYVTDMFTLLTDGNVSPNYIITGRQEWIYIANDQNANYRLTSIDNVALGVQGVTLFGIPVEYDRTISGRLYMLNTNYIRLLVEPTMNFDQIGWKSLAPVNQMGSINAILWRGELICLKPSMQGVLYNITA